jgi:hypothetical protein
VVCEGSSVSISALGSGSPSPAYQWRRNGVALAGATAATFSIGNAAQGDAGVYDCLVSNTCGTAVSNRATLSVVRATTITAPPRSQQLYARNTAYFTCDAAGADLRFHWRRDGVTLSDGVRVFGAQSRSLRIIDLTSNDSGNFDCVVTGSCGGTVSEYATLSVPCAADFNVDGGVDAADVAAFFVAWDQGLDQADVNQDGGTDGADIEMFFGAWEAGC